MRGSRRKSVESAGIEPEDGRKLNLLAPRDFGHNGFSDYDLPPPAHFAPIPGFPLDSPRFVEAFWTREGRFPLPPTPGWRAGSFPPPPRPCCVFRPKVNTDSDPT